MQFFSNVHNHKHSPPAHTSYIWHLSNTPHFHKFVYSVHTLHWVVCFLLSNGELALQTAVVNKLILNKCVWQKVPPPQGRSRMSSPFQIWTWFLVCSYSTFHKTHISMQTNILPQYWSVCSCLNIKLNIQLISLHMQELS